MKWTATDVVDALRHAYGLDGSTLATEEWSLLTEVPLRQPVKGYHGQDLPLNRWSANERTIDVLLVRNWSSGAGHRRLAVEVKVSKADYRNETDVKRAPAELAAHQTAYAAPAGLIDPDTLPDGWGLIEVYESHAAADAGTGWLLGDTVRSHCKWRVKPAQRVPACSMDYLVAAVARRASRAEERIRRGADDVALVPGLQAEVAKLTGQLERRTAAAERERSKATELRRQLAALSADEVCADCEQPVAYAIKGHQWVHRDKNHELPCHEARTETARLRREAATGARYLSAYPGPVEPKSLRDLRADAEDEDVLERRAYG